MDDTSLYGLWMFVEDAALQLDLGQQGLLDLNFQRRSFVFILDDIEPTPAGNTFIVHCMDNNFLSVEMGNANGGTVSFSVEGFSFDGSIVSNNRIEGSLSGISDGARMTRSDITLVKIADRDSAIVERTFDINVQAPLGQENIRDTPLNCFEQTDFEGESIVNGQRVSISGESLYMASIFDADNNGTIEGADVAMINTRGNGLDFRSLTVDTPDSFISNEETSTTNITVSSVSRLSGSASATDDFNPAVSVSITFDFEI